MTLQTIEIETGPNPVASIVLMHGLGADGNDFVPICDEMDFSAIGPVRFVFPNAPHIPVTINGGYRMPAWYDIFAPFTDSAPRREDEAGLRQSQAALNAVLEREKARGIPASRTVIAGFSQGCAMALLTGLRYPERLAGIVALSGYLPLASSTAMERHAANVDTPIFMAHGLQDPVVVLARAQEARESLQRLGYAIDWHDYPMPHSVCPQEIADLNQFLVKVLKAPSNA
jgi:phospholipase/carboxylesterase